VAIGGNKEPDSPTFRVSPKRQPVTLIPIVSADILNSPGIVTVQSHHCQRRPSTIVRRGWFFARSTDRGWVRRREFELDKELRKLGEVLSQ